MPPVPASYFISDIDKQASLFHKPEIKFPRYEASNLLCGFYEGKKWRPALSRSVMFCFRLILSWRIEKLYNK